MRRLDWGAVPLEQRRGLGVRNFKIERQAVLDQVGLQLDLNHPTIMPLPAWVIDAAAMPTGN